MQSKGYKFRIYPTEEQKQFLAKQFGGVRFIYNYFLEQRIEKYNSTKKSSSSFSDGPLLTQLKKQDEYKWLKEIANQSMQQSLRCLDAAYSNFFKKTTKFPKFHNRYQKQSIKYTMDFSIKKDGKLKIPKLKSHIKIVMDRELPATIKNLTVSKTSTNEYYASFQCEEGIQPLPQLDTVIGVDLGIKSLVVMSDGTEIKNPTHYINAQKELAYEQRQLSKKQKGSSNYKKQKLVVARLNQYIANSRLDHRHKLTKKLIDENQVIIAESLSVKELIENGTVVMSKYIQDASWGEIIRQLKYKAEWYGRTFHQVGRFFASSKTCNHCKYKLDQLSLSTRSWECPSCHATNDRDLNAAFNIRDMGLIELKQIELAQKSGSGIKSDSKQKLGEALPKLAGQRTKKLPSKKRK